MNNKLKQLKRNLNYANEIMNYEMPDNLRDEELVNQFDCFINQTVSLWKQILIDENIKITEEEK